MKHSCIFYIADRKINDLMYKLDMRDKGKVFCAPQPISFTTTTEVNEDYFMKIITESKKEKDHWIPAISYMDNFFCDPEINTISDGKNWFAVGEKK